MTIPHAPVAEELDGASVLDELCGRLTDYVVLPSVDAARAVALWIAATHAQSAWEHASRLHPRSPLKRCGKTRLLEVIAATAAKPLKTTNISAAALVRSINQDDPPTIILDEADGVFTRRRGEVSEQAETLRGIINAGHSRDWPYTRWDAIHRQLEECPTYAMAALASIGPLPDTIEDRAIVIDMRRRGPGEHVHQWRSKRVLPVLHAIRDRLSEWVRQHLAALAEADPELPVEDRAADVWAPLCAIAEAARGRWPARARRACLALTAAASAADEGALVERLLDDLYAVFGDRERMPTGDILAGLGAIEDAPWSDWHGKPLTARALAQLLRPYSVRPVQWPGGSRGYERIAFEDAWTRYRHTPEQSAHSAQPDSDAKCADDVRETAQEAHNTASDSIRAGVRFNAGTRLDGVHPVYCFACAAPAIARDQVGQYVCQAHLPRAGAVWL
jgi:Protein of unknown function (DUF3631)